MGANWFIGLPFPAGEWFAEVPAPPPQFRLFHGEDLHLTVAFLGQVTAEQAQAAWAYESAWPRGAIEVELARVVPMGRPGRYSALSAELSTGRAQVEQAIASVRHAMSDAAGVPRDHRGVRPHLTLARPSRRANDQDRARGLAWAHELALVVPPIRLDRIALYTWADDRTARLFRVVAHQFFA
jgi:2'-5' RNA ligase